MQISGDDLCRDGGRAQAEFLTNIGLDPGRKMSARADRPGELAHRHRFADRLEPLAGAPELVVHQSHLEAKGDRLGVNAMTSPNHWSVPVLPGFGRNSLTQLFHVVNKNVRRLRHLKGKSGVNHVAARQAEMEPTAGGRANVFSDVRRKGDDIMVEGALEFLATIEIKGRARLHLSQILFWNQALRRESFTGKQFDLQPDFEFALLAPDFPHDRAGVPLNHGLTLRTLMGRDKALVAMRKRNLWNGVWITVSPFFRGPAAGSSSRARSGFD